MFYKKRIKKLEKRLTDFQKKIDNTLYKSKPIDINDVGYYLSYTERPKYPISDLNKEEIDNLKKRNK